MPKHKAIAINTTINAFVPQPGSSEGTSFTLYNTQELANTAAATWAAEMESMTGIQGWAAFHETWYSAEELAQIEDQDTNRFGPGAIQGQSKTA